jgi:hypothetical protein
LSTANLNPDVRQTERARREQKITQLTNQLEATAALLNERDPSANITVPTTEQVLAQQTHCQRILTGIRNKCEQQTLIMDETLDDYDLVRLRACSHPRAMRAFAIPHKGASRFGHAEWRVAIQMALGMDVTAPGSQCPGCQTELLDTKGVHLINCKRFKGREIKQRHDSLVQHLKLFFSKAGSRVHLANQEELGWFTGEKRPDIVADILHGPRMGQAILYDVTVTHPFRQDFRTRRNLGKPGAAATAAEEAKRTKYTRHIVRPDLSSFVPLGFDAFGGWGESTTKEIKDHLARVASEEGSSQTVFGDWLTYQLSAAIWLYSATCLYQRTLQIEDPHGSATANWLEAAHVSHLNHLDE